MSQGVLPFKYESENKTRGLTALGGLPTYLDLAKVVGLSKSVQKHLTGSPSIYLKWEAWCAK